MFFLLVESTGTISPDETAGMVDDLESYILRRAVCGLTNKPYNRFFVGALRHLRKSPAVTRAALREYLTAGTGDSVRWPDDQEFGRAFVHRPVYRMLKRDVSSMMLQALERGLATPKHEQVELLGKLSIEHIMPQSWQEAWPLPDDSDENRERRERLLHTFGNLTLVTPQFNTALSNKAFLRKQKEFKRIARLLLSRTLEEVTGWDEQAILARGRTLFDVARRRWPHPQSPRDLDDVSLEYTTESWRVRAGSQEQEDVEEPPIDLPSALGLLDEFARVHATIKPAAEA
jgi:hypothetical protein